MTMPIIIQTKSFKERLAFIRNNEGYLSAVDYINSALACGEITITQASSFMKRI
jgi:hypothetical protein